MSTKVSARQIIVARILSPSILIGIGFLWFCYLPSQRAIQGRLAEIEKRSGSNSKPSVSFDLLNSRMISIQKENSAIDLESNNLNSQFESLAATKSQWENDFKSGGSQAKAIASALEIFRRNKLVCIDSVLVAVPAVKEERTRSHSPKTPASGEVQNNEHSKAMYRVHILGRFEDVRSALADLIKAQSNVVPISIDMDDPDPLCDQRNWTLILEIEQRI